MSKSHPIFPISSAPVGAKSHPVFPQNSRNSTAGTTDGLVAQVAYGRLNEDIVLANTTPTTVIQRVIATEEGSRLTIRTSLSGSVESVLETQVLVEYNVFLDGESVTGSHFAMNPLGGFGVGEATAFFYTDPLPAGIHVVHIEATVTGGTVSVAPVATDDREHAQILIEEIRAA